MAVVAATLAGVGTVAAAAARRSTSGHDGPASLHLGRLPHRRRHLHSLFSSPTSKLFALSLPAGGDSASVYGALSGSGDGGGGSDYGGGDAGGSNSGDGDGGNKGEVMKLLAAVGRGVESLPNDLAEAILRGDVMKETVERYLELEKSMVFRWLLGFDGFKERLLADDLFLTKVAIEVGVGIFTKSAAELEKRKESFFRELDFVTADVIMALVADFMLVWLPAPTVHLRKPFVLNAGPIAQFFAGCPENAFQVAYRGTSYSLLQRGGAILRNGLKLFAVGTSASLIGTATTNGLIRARQFFDHSYTGGIENVPILSTSAAYGVYMAVSSNLRYQLVAGVIEQRLLEPLLHNNKFLLGALCFAVRTGNTFLGSLLWVDYARWVGVQRTRE